MFVDLALLTLSLAIILCGCELFTNGVEWMGARLKIGDGIVGSILSALGTCFPETSVAMIAILSSHRSRESMDLSIGAIAGAPFMLGTLAFFVAGASVVLFRKSRKSGWRMKVNLSILQRDLIFFLTAYTLGISATFFPYGVARYAIAGILCALYFIYIAITVSHDMHKYKPAKGLYLRHRLFVKSNRLAFFLQMALALFGILYGAKIFVAMTSKLARALGVSVMLLSLVITPIATELPEKFNSVIWIRRGRDTLAVGNITGAMVFQSCIPICIGILATPWQLDGKILASALLTVTSTVQLLLWVRVKHSVNPLPFLMGGVLYSAFIAAMVANGLV